MAATELSSSPVTTAESLVPACMFAPDRGCGEDVTGTESCEDGDTFNGEAVDHLDFTSKFAMVSPTGEQYDSLLRQLRGGWTRAVGRPSTLWESAQNNTDELQAGSYFCPRQLHVPLRRQDYGLDEGDMDASVATVQSLCEQIGADLILLRERNEAAGRVRDYLIRRRVGDTDFLEVRVAVVGNVDAEALPPQARDGERAHQQRGERHPGFDHQGLVVNKPDSHGGSLDWTKICEKSSKVITFIDLAGHEKYLKTTVFGMTGHLPDFCMLMVGNRHVSSQHLARDTEAVTEIAEVPRVQEIPVLVQNKDDVIVTASNFSSERMCPIFQISNVTGENMDLLKMFLNLLSSRTSYNDEEPPEFQIDDTYSVRGEGGQTASFALKKIKRSTIRKGMIPGYGALRQHQANSHHPDHDRDCLRTGDKAAVHFRFIKTPEYLHTEQRLVFREGRTKAVGTVTKLLQSANNLPSNSKNPQMKMQSSKKTQPRREEEANEEAASTGRPASPHLAQLQVRRAGVELNLELGWLPLGEEGAVFCRCRGDVV
ncbi:hypothetical protein SKAU_G00426660 [Synaphobranchus kaupii]|uniref:GTP-binding protein 1 n=1 Tax=Synaphobranchus kaupii TaxID=118154 RepID=A0A9Q1IA95_SYNKA|nr:hypothetical protein SKAU_G00426660 [Synaphobranchus kaupii]